MRLIESPAAMRAAAADAKRAVARIGFVPTMGFLHEGHLSLVREARRRTDLVVLSSFVNPLQFGPSEDYATYPRDPERDRALAQGAGVDLLWIPPTEQMYPVPPVVTVSPGTAGTILEGAIRPGHFAGVLTVVLKLFQAVQPDVAVFGRKDAQQAALVRLMIRDLDLPVELVVAPTVREADALALSSRNIHLDAGMRRRALVLPRALAAGVAGFRGGERRSGALVAATAKVLGAEDGITVEYVNVVDPDSFSPSHAATERSFLVAAIRLGPTRLIDNVVLGEGLETDPRAEDGGRGSDDAGRVEERESVSRRESGRG